jgi:hypothetical protein
LADERATGRDVIEAIAQNMESSLEPLVTKTVAPSLYQVYLHNQDFERLRTIFGDIEADAKRHLDQQLAKLNRGAVPVAGRVLSALRPRRRDPAAGEAERAAPRYVSAEGRWVVHFQEDPNGELQPGDVRVASEFGQAPSGGFGSGSLTRRISTTTRLGRPAAQQPSADASAAFARISYRDDSGPKEFLVFKDEVVIGRDAPALDVWVDLRLETSLDVSREHARLRRLPETGAFRIKDFSKLGTTVNGRPLAPNPLTPQAGGGAEADQSRWSDLPDRARIGLAGILFLDFERIVKP